ESPQRAIANVKKAMKTSQKAAARVVMTEQAFFTTAAQKDSYQELDVEEYEFVCTLDKITCELCGAMDGKHFPINELEVGVNAPPMHPFCRCITCPYFNDEFIVGKRASRDENGKTVYEVPEKMKYEEWKERFINKDFHFEEKNIEKSSIIVDIVFQSKLPNSKVMNDKKTVLKAFSELPIKVQQKMNDVVFNMGNSGSGCDYKNGVIYVAQGAEKQDIHHEIGHLL
ncbi:MAG: minor capsid protein, partial [Lachnospiraceae bacterium]|nr:minor capsid protein [Lachnospiraceae bacterium]